SMAASSWSLNMRNGVTLFMVVYRGGEGDVGSRSVINTSRAEVVQGWQQCTACGARPQRVAGGECAQGGGRLGGWTSRHPIRYSSCSVIQYQQVSPCTASLHENPVLY